MAGASFPRQVLSVVFRTAPVFQPGPGEPLTFAGHLRGMRGYRDKTGLPSSRKAAEEPAATPENERSISDNDLGRLTVRLHAYSDMRDVAEAYRSGRPVLMDTSHLTVKDAKRSVDFAAGLIFGVRGGITRVGNHLFMLAPPDQARADENLSSPPRLTVAPSDHLGDYGDEDNDSEGDGDYDEGDGFAALNPLDTSADGRTWWVG